MSAETDIVPIKIVRIREEYRERREQTLLDAAAASLSIHTIFNADVIDFDAVTPQMRESFGLAFPRNDLNETLSDMASNTSDTQIISGFMNAWRGKHFEVIVRDRLNAGEHVGELTLSAGQTAILSEELGQPGWDLQIVNDSGDAVSEIQLKATDSLFYVKKALERYPDIDVLTTSEISDQLIDEMVISSDISNAGIEDELSAAVDSVVESPLEDIFEGVFQGLPVILIAGTEGAMWLAGRQTVEQAFARSKNRLVKTGAAMSVGALVAIAGGGVFSLPATFATRMGISRYESFSRASHDVRYNIDRVRSIRSETG